jgi:hypothetical protein
MKEGPTNYIYPYPIGNTFKKWGINQTVFLGNYDEAWVEDPHSYWLVVFSKQPIIMRLIKDIDFDIIVKSPTNPPLYYCHLTIKEIEKKENPSSNRIKELLYIGYYKLALNQANKYINLI